MGEATLLGKARGRVFGGGGAPCVGKAIILPTCLPACLPACPALQACYFNVPNDYQQAVCQSSWISWI